VELETRLDARFMDLRRKETLAIFQIRNTVLAAGHEYLRGHGFFEIHSPRIIAASSEGGTDLFKVKYFERDAYLAQSPQLYKQSMMATGLDRVYEVATYFRARNTRRSDTSTRSQRSISRWRSSSPTKRSCTRSRAS